MNKTIREHIEKERIRDIRERERAKRVRDYHRKILEADGGITGITEEEVSELFSDDRSFSSVLAEIRALKQGVARGGGDGSFSDGTPRFFLPNIDSSRGARRTPDGGFVAKTKPGEFPGVVKSKTKLMSMATELGAKPKAFGTAAIEKRKKKKKGKKKKRKH